MRHPAASGAEHIQQFLSYLALEEDVAASTQNQALAALLFLYPQVLEQELSALEGAVRGRRPARLPTVLTPAEARAVLGALKGTAGLGGRSLSS